MNILDIVFCVIIGLLALRCFFKGLVHELMTKASILGAALLAILFYRIVGGWLSKLVNLGEFAPIAGFIAVALVVFIIMKLLQASIATIVEGLHIQPIDKALGLILGLSEGILLSSLILIALSYQPVFDLSATFEGSFFARILLPLIARQLPSIGA